MQDEKSVSNSMYLSFSFLFGYDLEFLGHGGIKSRVNPKSFAFTRDFIWTLRL